MISTLLFTIMNELLGFETPITITNNGTLSTL